MSHGHIQQFSVTYEREIDRYGFRISYVGSRSSGLDYQLNTNLAKPGIEPYNPAARPYPQFVDTTMLEFNGSAKFDSLQLEAKRRVAGFTLEANYSLSRSIQNDLDVENPYDVLSHWANDGVTRRNYASASVVYSLPFGQGKRFLGDSGPTMNRIVGGWTTSFKHRNIRRSA